ncbi:MAG: Mandelate racemase/muconate lactonizing protein [Verrucomicrobia bacterium]|nr:Mandelate racemase/muconate lactonizing protein [Verrucomicrobiota bacterium]
MTPIVRVEIGRFDYTVAGEFKFFKPGPDGRVTRPSVLVRLTDADGQQGWGQSVPVPSWTYETVESVMSTLRFYLAEIMLGRDPADFSGLHAAMNAAIRPAFSVGQPLCKAALDLACHDLAGRQRGVPAWKLFGPPSAARDRLTLSWTVASPSMDAVERQLSAGRARGYRNFNIKVGAPQTADYDVALAKCVRAFAPEGFLWADANTGYTTDEVLALAPKLRDAGVDVLESPLPPTQIRGYQALKKLGALPVLMDEGILSPAESAEFMALGMMDGIAMKPARNAGLWPSVQIVTQLRERGLMVLGSGLTDPDLSLSAAAHLFAWAGIAQPCALNGPQFLSDRLSGETLVPENDALTVPTGPGLGLALDPRAEACLETAAGS